MCLKHSKFLTVPSVQAARYSIAVVWPTQKWYIRQHVITAKVQLHELEKVGLVCIYSELVGKKKMKNVAYKDLAFGRLISIQDFIWRQVERQLLVHACCACSLNTDSHTACRAHAVPLPCRAVNSHLPCRAPALLLQCRVLRESPRGSRKYPNC